VNGTWVLPDDPTEREALAGEYVLGTLDRSAAEAVRAALSGDPAFAAVVAAWEQRLAPLMVLAPETAPPPETWAAIAARIAPAAATVPATPIATRVRAGWQRLLGAGLAGAAVAGLAVFFAIRPPAPAADRYVAVMQADQAAPAWVVEAERGAITVAAINRPAIPAGRVMQVWGLAPGDPGPTSLGFVPTDGTRFAVDTSRRPPVDGMLVEISLEPPGGSPIGRPTGPVLFIGRLQRVPQ
jgi:anti-sigma-K factor RskA